MAEMPDGETSEAVSADAAASALAYLTEMSPDLRGGAILESGGSVLAAAIAVALAGMNGMRHLRKLLSGDSFRVVRLDGSQYTDVAEPEDRHDTSLVQLDRSEYTEVR